MIINNMCEKNRILPISYNLFITSKLYSKFIRFKNDKPFHYLLKSHVRYLNLLRRSIFICILNTFFHSINSLISLNDKIIIPIRQSFQINVSKHLSLYGT